MISLHLLVSALCLSHFLIARPQTNSGSMLDAETLFELRATTVKDETRENNNVMNDNVHGKSLFQPDLAFGVDYYPSQWPEELWESDAQHMSELGLQYIRIGEFDWGIIEPVEGKYNFTLWDKSISILGKHGLKVILGTPTATPPIWVSQNYDTLGEDQFHAKRRFGSRRHYSFSSPDYRRLSKQITTKMVERYGSNKYVAGWQLDNEFGCHGTVRTYDNNARKAFQKWLTKKYDSVEKMNRLQGRVFWSSAYQSFDQVDVPTQEVTESNPGMRLDFYQFSSDQVISFAKEQVDIIRKHAPQAFVTTNFMGFFFDYDHHKFMNVTQLDLATWDMYPLGMNEQSSWISDVNKVKYGRTGNPDSQALNHAIYRGVAGAAFGKTSGRWGLMEQQPGGPVNWAPFNPSPEANMLRLWLHEELAGSANFISIFRWREVPYAEEQMHAALYRRDNVPDVGYYELEQVMNEDVTAMSKAGIINITQNGASAFLKPAPQAQVAMIVDYNSGFVLESEPQAGTWDTNAFTGYPFVWPQILLNWYSGLRRVGIHVDVIGPNQPLDGYKLIVVPTMPIVGKEIQSRLESYNGSIVFGPRSASKVPSVSIPDGLPPSTKVIRDRLPMKVTRVESLRSDIKDKVSYNGQLYNVTTWSEWLECSRDGRNASRPGEATFSGYRDGKPATCAHTDSTTGTTTHYVGYYPDSTFIAAYLSSVASEAGVTDVLGRKVSLEHDLGPDLRLSAIGGSGGILAVNYGPETTSVKGLPDGTETIIHANSANSSDIPYAGLSVFKLPA